MAVAREAIEHGGISPDWCPDEYYTPVGEPDYVTPDPRTDYASRTFTESAVLFYQKKFNHLYPLDDIASQKAFDSALVEQEPGGKVIYESMRRRQLATSAKTQR
jgi:hypothetical protein